MSNANLIDLFFRGMEKLGPGSNSDTLKVLAMLPQVSHEIIVDAGCGSGRQTLALASQLQELVHAVDSYEPFLSNLEKRAKAAGIENLVKTYCMDMANIPNKFQGIGLLWSESAAYNIGFPHALKTWHTAVKAGGFLVVSELSWLRDDAPADVQKFFQAVYPDMRTSDENRTVAEDAGYNILATHTLPRETWVEGYYDIQEPRAKGLLDHPDKDVRAFATETIEEIRVFNCSEDSYGYVFYVMERT